MKLLEKSLEQLIDLALKTTILGEMFFLKNHSSMNVRRALAANSNISESVLECLLNDPVENVSYKASLHPKAKVRKEFNHPLRPCVICDKSEKYLNCLNCSMIESHLF